ncbi:MAG: alpha/beta hydrolase [Actinobacteria bacterium]|nr:alpha/beta hydrolase [Actinomycetota bacterium]
MKMFLNSDHEEMTILGKSCFSINRRAAITVLLTSLFITVLTLGLSGCKESAAPEINSKITESKVKKVAVGDIEIAYKTFGEGTPLLLIMGYSGTMDMWDPDLINNLSTSHRVIVFDNRGTGDTSSGDHEFTIEQFADDTAGLLNALGIKNGNILGWSMGTNIAQELVLRNPDMVDGLILYAADPGGGQAVPPSPKVMNALGNTSGDPSQRGERLLNLLFPSGWLSNEENMNYVQSIFSETMKQVSPDAVEKQYTAMVSWTGSYNRLHSIKSKTLLITGADDILTPPENSVLMVAQIPGSWLIQFQDAGHGLQYQEPLRMSRAILYFLE